MFLYSYVFIVVFAGCMQSVDLPPKEMEGYAHLKGIACDTPWVSSLQKEISFAQFFEWIDLFSHRSICLLDETEKELLGYVFYDRADKEMVEVGTELGITKEIWVIVEIAKSHKHIRRGVGGELLDRAHAAMGLEKCLSLHVAITNIIAINFYRKKGFLISRVKEKYYTNTAYALKVGEDAYIMFHTTCFEKKKDTTNFVQTCDVVKSTRYLM